MPPLSVTDTATGSSNTVLSSYCQGACTECPREHHRSHPPSNIPWPRNCHRHPRLVCVGFGYLPQQCLCQARPRQLAHRSNHHLALADRIPAHTALLRRRRLELCGCWCRQQPIARPAALRGHLGNQSSHGRSPAVNTRTGEHALDCASAAADVHCRAQFVLTGSGSAEAHQTTRMPAPQRRL